jgi:hypothetical protein
MPPDVSTDDHAARMRHNRIERLERMIQTQQRMYNDYDPLLLIELENARAEQSALDDGETRHE